VSEVYALTETVVDWQLEQIIAELLDGAVDE